MYNHTLCAYTRWITLMVALLSRSFGDPWKPSSPWWERWRFRQSRRCTYGCTSSAGQRQWKWKLRMEAFSTMFLPFLISDFGKSCSLPTDLFFIEVVACRCYHCRAFDIPHLHEWCSDEEIQQASSVFYFNHPIDASRQQDLETWKPERLRLLVGGDWQQGMGILR